MPLRLPRLTLFTGPNCSLCEVGKMRPFVQMSVVVDEGGDRSVTDSEGGTRESASESRFQLGYRQHPGRGSGILEEEICLLDSSSASGGEGDSEGEVGWGHGGKGSGEVGCREEGQRRDSMSSIAASDAPLFYADVKGMCLDELLAREYWQFRELDYNRVLDNSDEFLGSSPSPDRETSGGDAEMRCFNCGVEGHAVRDCAETRNHQLIALSRSMYQFYRDLEGRAGASEPERIHVVEAWRSQRLRWVDHFSPGEIKGEVLRDALGLQDGDKGETVDWLSNMLVWGYPKGWVGVPDPRRAVRRRIWGPSANREDRHEFDFVVFGEDGNDERLSFKPPPINDAKTTDDDDEDDDSGSVSSTKTLRSRNSSPKPGSNSEDPKPRRWAHFETTLFSSELLPVYNGSPLPPMESDNPRRTGILPSNDKTFTEDRASLWERLLDQQGVPPPPPPGTPPPLPPPPGTVVVDDVYSGWNSFEAGSWVRDWCSQPFQTSSAPGTSKSVADDGVAEEDMDLSD